jgi:hypothetical protein
MATNRYKYLRFFGKKGDPLNLEYDDASDSWSGELYFERVSTSLYENEQVLILEEVRTGYVAGNQLIMDGVVRYTYPILWNNEYFSPPPPFGAAEWQAMWKDDAAKTHIELYTVENQRVVNKQGEVEDAPFIVTAKEVGVEVDQSLPSQQYITLDQWLSHPGNTVVGPPPPAGIKILVKPACAGTPGDFNLDYGIDYLVANDCAFDIDPTDFDPTDFVSTNITNPWTERDLDSRPLKFNVYLTSADEAIYQRSLLLKDASFGPLSYTPNNSAVTFATIDFYGETIGEDERLRLVLENFGRSFDQADAFITREFDIEENLPDWQIINQKRKELMLVNNEIFPYLGSYRGFISAIRFFGYQDLRVKEYWLNVNMASPDYGKYLQQQINGLLLDEQSSPLKHPLVDTKTYRKTAKFGLFYDITKETGDYDQYGIPVTADAFQFSPEEVLVKLFALKERLKRDFLPLDARIVDIVGEGIYFERIGIRNWEDDLKVLPLDVNEEVNFTATPSLGYVRDLRRLRVQRFPGGLTLPVDNFTNTVNPYTGGQQYPPTAVPSLVQAIEDFYTELRTFPFPYTGQKELYSYDEPGVIAGCPVVFHGVLNLFDWDMMRTTWDHIADMTWDNIDFRHFYEIEWIIEKPGPNPYYFSIRGKVADYQDLPHFLPYAGKYKVTMRLYDLYNSYSVKSTEGAVEVLPRELEVAVLTRFRSTDDYTWDGGAKDLTWDDLAASELHFPIEGVSPQDNPVAQALSNWARYRNQDDFLVLDPDGVRREYLLSQHPNVTRLGTRFISWESYHNLTWDDMYHTTIDMTDYHGDFLGGFRIFDPAPGDVVSINDWPGHTFGPIVTLQDAADELNAETDPGIAIFEYVVRFQPLAGNYSISDYAIGTADYSFYNNGGGDNWAFTVNDPASYFTLTAAYIKYHCKLQFWRGGAAAALSTIVGTGPASGTTAGNGAGVYQLTVRYEFSSGLAFTVNRYVAVDVSGNILADVRSDGSLFNSMFHMTIDEFGTLSQTGVSFPFTWQMTDGINTTAQGTPNQLGVHVLSNTTSGSVQLLTAWGAPFTADVSSFDPLFQHDIAVGPGVHFIHAQARTPGSDGWRFVYYSGSVHGDAHSFRQPTWLGYQYDDPYYNFLAMNPTVAPAITFLDMLSQDDTVAGVTDSLTYWENAGYIKTEPPTSLYPLGERRGHLPSWAGSGAFSNEVRIYTGDFTVPLGVTLFFVCNHSEVPGKNDFRWKIVNEVNGKTVIDVKGKGFLIYTFDEPSQYSVYLSLTDTNGNYSETYKRGMVTVEKIGNI